MRKFPGTLYKVGVIRDGDATYRLTINYRNETILDKSVLNAQGCVDNLEALFKEKGLPIPKNRIELIIKEECGNANEKPPENIFKNTVTDMVKELDKGEAQHMNKILLIGLSNAGKTCIYQRVFEGKTSWQLMQSSATKGIVYKDFNVGSMARPVIWDLGGQEQYLSEYHGSMKDNIFNKATLLLYVIDIMDTTRFDQAREEFTWAATQLLQYNPNASIHVFLHKIDLAHDRESIIKHFHQELSEKTSIDVHFHPTSILDESLFVAWSEIIREISPRSTFINIILKQLQQQEGVHEAILIDKETGLACSTTVKPENEVKITGMVSLLIMTIERVIKTMELNQFQELKLITLSNSLLLSKVTDDLLLVTLVDKSALDEITLNNISEAGKKISNQLKEMWE